MAPLTDDTLRVLIAQGGSEALREYRQMFDVTYVTAFRDLTELVNVGQATMIGAGRSRRYRAGAMSTDL